MKVFVMKTGNSYYLKGSHEKRTRKIFAQTKEQTSYDLYTRSITFITLLFLVQFGLLCSQNGKQFSIIKEHKELTVSVEFANFCDGMLCANYRLPVIKRKTAMKEFEDKVNYNLLHTYVYVAYLDKINELNNLNSNQKDVFLGQLCTKPGYKDVLCLNLIMNSESLLSTAL